MEAVPLCVCSVGVQALPVMLCCSQRDLVDTGMNPYIFFTECCS